MFLFQNPPYHFPIVSFSLFGTVHLAIFYINGTKSIFGVNVYSIWENSHSGSTICTWRLKFVFAADSTHQYYFTFLGSDRIVAQVPGSPSGMILSFYGSNVSLRYCLCSSRKPQTNCVNIEGVRQGFIRPKPNVKVLHHGTVADNLGLSWKLDDKIFYM